MISKTRIMEMKINNNTEYTTGSRCLQRGGGGGSVSIRQERSRQHTAKQLHRSKHRPNEHQPPGTAPLFRLPHGLSKFLYGFVDTPSYEHGSGHKTNPVKEFRRQRTDNAQSPPFANKLFSELGVGIKLINVKQEKPRVHKTTDTANSS